MENMYTKRSSHNYHGYRFKTLALLCILILLFFNSCCINSSKNFENADLVVTNFDQSFYNDTTYFVITVTNSSKGIRCGEVATAKKHTDEFKISYSPNDTNFHIIQTKLFVIDEVLVDHDYKLEFKTTFKNDGFYIFGLKLDVYDEVVERDESNNSTWQ